MANGKSIDEIHSVKIIKVHVKGTIPERGNLEIDLTEVVTGRYLDAAQQSLIDWAKSNWPGFKVERQGAAFKYD